MSQARDAKQPSPLRLVRISVARPTKQLANSWYIGAALICISRVFYFLVIHLHFLDFLNQAAAGYFEFNLESMFHGP